MNCLQKRAGDEVARVRLRDVGAALSNVDVVALQAGCCGRTN